MLAKARPLRAIRWRQRISVRRYEWIGYGLAAVTGGAWGALSIGLLFQHTSTGAFSYLTPVACLARPVDSASTRRCAGRTHRRRGHVGAALPIAYRESLQGRSAVAPSADQKGTVGRSPTGVV